MSLSTVSATIVDPSGQAFANGTWQLVFKPAPNTPGLFTDGGVSFTTIFRGNLDGAGSFSQAVARNDTIAPAGSRWTLTVVPNASGQAFSVDLNVNSGAFNASAAINAVVINIVIPATILAHAYKDSEVLIPPSSGAQYYDVVNKVLKLWDSATQTWVSTITSGGAILANPLGNQTIVQPVGTNLFINRFENTRYADQFSGADMAAKIVAAYNDGPATGVCVDATAFEGAQNWASNPFAGIAFGSTKSLYLKLGNVQISASVPIVVQCSNIVVVGRGWRQTSFTYTGGVNASFWKVGTTTPTVNQLLGVQLFDFQISGSANITDALLITGCHHSNFIRLDARNCTGAAWHTQFAVCNVYDNPQCSLNNGAFTQQPANGLLFDQIDINHQTTASPVINPIIEGLSGSGIKLSGCEAMSFYNGTSEQCNRGIEVIVSVNNNNTFDGIDLELNTIEDVLDLGIATEYRNIKSTKLIHLAGAAQKVKGGENNSYQIDAGTNNTDIDSTWNFSGTGTILDNGTNTAWKLLNPATGSLLSLISGSFGAGAGTESTSGWVFRNTTPSKGSGVITQPDSMDMLRSSYSFPTTGIVLSTTPIASAIWRLLFIGSWANNFEGGGLAQPGIIQEVTSANPTIIIGTQIVTFSKNGSNQLVGTSTANIIEFVGTILVCSNIQGLTGTSSALYKGDVVQRRLKASSATTLVIGDFAASGGFGTTVAFTIALGKDQGGQVTITPGGAGIAANPTVTLTFHDGTWTTAPSVVASRGDLQAPTGGYWAVTSISATQVVFTFVGLPVSGTSYVLQFITMGN